MKNLLLIFFDWKYAVNGTLISLACQHFDNLFLVYFFLVHLRFHPCCLFSWINHPLQKGSYSRNEMMIYDA